MSRRLIYGIAILLAILLMSIACGGSPKVEVVSSRIELGVDFNWVIVEVKNVSNHDAKHVIVKAKIYGTVPRYQIGEVWSDYIGDLAAGESDTCAIAWGGPYSPPKSELDYEVWVEWE